MNKRSRIERILCAVFGALPATVAAVAALLLVASAIDRLTSSLTTGMLGILWGAAGIAGVISAWVYVARFEQLTNRHRSIVLYGIVAGVLAASLALMQTWDTSAVRIKLLLLFPIAVGLFAIFRLSATRFRFALIFTALVAVAIASAPIAYSSLTVIRHVEFSGRWKCGDYGACTEFVAFSIMDDTPYHRLVTERGLLEHLRSLPVNEIQIGVQAECVLGFYRGYRVVDLGGFEYSLENFMRSKLPGDACD